MLNRNVLMLAAGAAIFTLDATVAVAQTRATSTKRIPISKEAPPPAPPRVDTVTVYKTDTLRTMGRVDTMRVPGPTVTTVVHDTVVQQVRMVAQKLTGMYFGLGAGPNLTFGAIRTVNQAGPVGQLQAGWQSMSFPVGVRLDGNYTEFSHTAAYAVLGDRPQAWGANLDLRVNLPIFNGFLGSSIRMTPYLLGGGSTLYYRNLRMKLDTDAGVIGGFGQQHAVIAGSESNINATTALGVTNTDWHDSWGWNYGGGLAFNAGKTALVVEARGIPFNRDSDHFELIVGRSDRLRYQLLLTEEHAPEHSSERN